MNVRRRVSPRTDRYQIILLGDKRHMYVKDLLRKAGYREWSVRPVDRTSGVVTATSLIRTWRSDGPDWWSSVRAVCGRRAHTLVCSCRLLCSRHIHRLQCVYSRGQLYVCACVCVWCRMQEKERQWRARVEASIESKDARSRMIQREREAAKKHVRRYLCHYCTVAPPTHHTHTRTLVSK